MHGGCGAVNGRWAIRADAVAPEVSKLRRRNGSWTPSHALRNPTFAERVPVWATAQRRGPHLHAQRGPRRWTSSNRPPPPQGGGGRGVPCSRTPTLSPRHCARCTSTSREGVTPPSTLTTRHTLTAPDRPTGLCRGDGMPPVHVPPPPGHNGCPPPLWHRGSGGGGGGGVGGPAPCGRPVRSGSVHRQHSPAGPPHSPACRWSPRAAERTHFGPLFWLPLLPRCAPPLCSPLSLLVWLPHSVCLCCSSPVCWRS